MAKGDELRFTPQLIITAALVLGLAPLLAFAVEQGSVPHFDRSLFFILSFTVKQAALSTFFSVLPGLLIARALARENFRGQALLLWLFALPMAMPAIVAVLGLIGLIGNSGLFPGLISPYGLAGILIVHVFFNLPMATRLIYQALQSTPEEATKLSAQLGLSELQNFRHVEWPAVRAVLPQLSAIIFLLCAASFVVVLTLGGPAATTLEVAIFQSLRMDFEPPRALALSMLQVALCAALIGFAQAAFSGDQGFASLRAKARQWQAPSALMRILNFSQIAFGALSILPVIGVIAWRGLNGFHFDARAAQALGTSLIMGFCSATVALLLAWPLAKAQDKLSKLLSLAGLIVPPAVIATGWFLLVRRWSDSLLLTLCFIIALNALMALPYAVAALRGAQRRFTPFIKLQNQLGISGLTALRVIEWPLLRSAFAQAFLLAMVLSLGDLTAITLLGSNGILTLPTLLHAEMGHYRGQAADGTALLLLLPCGALTYVAQKVGSQNADA